MSSSQMSGFLSWTTVCGLISANELPKSKIFNGNKRAYSPSLCILYVYTLPLSEFLTLQKKAPNMSLRVLQETLAAERYDLSAVELSRSCWGRGNSWPKVSEAGPEDVQSLLTQRRDASAEDTTGSGFISVTSEMSRALPETQSVRYVFIPQRC